MKLTTCVQSAGHNANTCVGSSFVQLNFKQFKNNKQLFNLKNGGLKKVLSRFEVEAAFAVVMQL
jgi:hypothetical protein